MNPLLERFTVCEIHTLCPSDFGSEGECRHMSVFDVLKQYHEALWSGLEVTMLMCAYIWGFGLFAGALLGVAGAKWQAFVGIPARAISFVLSSVPALVFLFWLHYPVQYQLQIRIDPFVTGTFLLAMLNTFFVSDVVRGAITEFPKQYVLAAKVCGLTSNVITWHIQFPIILRQAIPTLLLLQVSMLQATLFTSFISVPEIFRVAQRINSDACRPVEVYTAVGVFFLLVCLPLNAIAIWLRRKFTRDLSEV